MGRIYVSLVKILTTEPDSLSIQTTFVPSKYFFTCLENLMSLIDEKNLHPQEDPYS